MAPQIASQRSRILARTAAIVLLSGFTAACSTSSMTTGATSGASPAAYTGQPMPPALVGTNPIANGQQNLPPAAAYPPGTGPSAAVTTAALPPPAATPANNGYYTPPAAAPLAAPMAAAPVAAPPTQVAAAATAPATAQGTTITVQPGETLYSLSRTHGVSVAAIAGANGLTQTSLLTIGQRIFIPAPGSPAALGTPAAPLGVITTQGPATAAPATTQVAAATQQPTGVPGQHTVQPGETMYSIAQAYGVSPNVLAQANNMTQPELVRSGQTLVIPGTATRAPVTAPVVAQASPAPVVTAAVAPAAAAVPTAPLAPVAAAAPAAVAAVAPATVAAPSVNGTSFRWPARGRVISDFGPKPGGERNDGINLALPEGTQILAAEAGTIIYAGNEIPGYGNLVLIRHADNWVTAYAHASQILVAKDQVVARGQAVALVGATGSVTSPQLHFELRRGSTPVNPLDYLTD